jgi:hypothetical protein
MSFDSHGQPPSANDSTAYPIWRRECNGNRPLLTPYGNPHPHFGSFHPAVREPYDLWNVVQLYFKNAEENTRRCARSWPELKRKFGARGMGRRLDELGFH